MSTGGAYSRNGGSGGRKRSRIRVPGGRPTPTRCGNRAERPKMERALFDFRRKPRLFGRGGQRDSWGTFFGRKEDREGRMEEMASNTRKKKIFPKVVPQLYTQPPPNPSKLCYESGVLSRTLSLDFRRTGSVFL